MNNDYVSKQDIESTDSPPSSPKENKEYDNLSQKEVAKIASKSFGYIQRSIELLGRDSTRLAGARDFSNTLHWTQAMKFLKERGFIYTKTGHGTSVAEQFANLAGLERAFQEQFQLENFPLPRLSKTHMDRMDPKSPLYEENSPKIMMAGHYDGNTFNNNKFVAQNNVTVATPPSMSHPMQPSPNSPNYPRNMSYPIANATVLYGRHPPNSYLLHLQHEQPTTATPMEPGLVAPIPKRLSAPEIPTISNRGANSDNTMVPNRSALPRKLSVPEVPLPVSSFSQHTKPPTVSIQANSEGVMLPPLSNLTSCLPEDKRSTTTTPSIIGASTSNSINSILTSNVRKESDDKATQLAQEALHTLRQKAADAMLLQNFYEKVNEHLPESQKKRSLPPPTVTGYVQRGSFDKKARYENQRVDEWRMESAGRQEREILFC